MGLVSRVHELAISAQAVRCLAVLLWAANKRGVGEGCHPEECMLLRREGGLAHAMGIAGDGRSNRSSVRRAKEELRPFVRWVRVNFAQRTPDLERVDRPSASVGSFTGARVRGGALCVYYVNVAKLWRALGRHDLADRGTATEASPDVTGPIVADGVNHDAINGVSAPAETGRKCAEPVARGRPRDTLSVVNPVVSFNKPRSQSTTAHPPPVVVVVSDESRDGEIDDLFGLWHTAIGARVGAHGPACESVRDALRGAIAAGVPSADLADAIAGRADEHLGGAAFRWCVEHHVWAASLFVSRSGKISGCLSYLVQSVRAVRATDEREARLRAARQLRASCDEPDERPMTAAELAAATECARRGVPWTRQPADRGQPAGGDGSATSLPEPSSEAGT
jgi:hypothetical protein